jgi:hypothetical protein
VFFRYVDRTAPKNDIRDELLWLASDNGEELSRARADKLANKFKRGEFDPMLARFIQYSDPTGETASRNADKERATSAATLAA